MKPKDKLKPYGIYKTKQKYEYEDISQNKVKSLM